MNVLAANLIILFFVFTLVWSYGLDIKRPYPKVVLDMFHEPGTRFLGYIVVYLISGLSLLLLNLDYINLYLK
jgi:hypothetical protein